MSQILRYVLLPREITDFERRYLDRMNRVALYFFAAHIPVFAIVALLNRTGAWSALALGSAVLVGPLIARHSIRNPRTVSIVHGVTAMFMGGLLVHFGQGPMQIEMHFYFFALIAMCAVFGNPMVIVAAAVTVALHHLIVWLVLPRSVFNYDASVWVVAIHAAFVVLDSIAACFISRVFFDNVIGLEHIVQIRTAALDAKNRDLRTLLDNVQQGFLTIDLDGALALERSGAVDRWFGAPSPTMSWFDYLTTISPEFSAQCAFAWKEVVADIMPLELTLDQMPSRFAFEKSIFDVAYRPIGDEPHARFLVIVTDITSQVEREKAESERKETMALFERVLEDRTGCETFIEEGTQIVASLTRHANRDLAIALRLLHTLKGNAAIFGLTTIASICHALEDLIAEQGVLPSPTKLASLEERWSRLAGDVERLLGKEVGVLRVEESDYRDLLDAALRDEPKGAMVERIRGLKLESAEARLAHFAQQAERIAAGLEKSPIEIRVAGNGVRLDSKKWSSFWSAFIHAIRNALDHGIEDIQARTERGKSPSGILTLSAQEDASALTIEVADDGAGIDWEAVAARARKAGLAASSPTDLRDSLFADGVSTAKSVTDLSGRGVGMGALLEATRALGGDVVVESESGKGTRLRMVFPRAADVPAPSHSSSAAA